LAVVEEQAQRELIAGLAREQGRGNRRIEPARQQRNTDHRADHWIVNACTADRE
jgi:hypothetical protein